MLTNGEPGLPAICRDVVYDQSHIVVFRSFSSSRACSQGFGLVEQFSASARRLEIDCEAIADPEIRGMCQVET